MAIFERFLGFSNLYRPRKINVQLREINFDQTETSGVPIRKSDPQIVWNDFYTVDFQNAFRIHFKPGMVISKTRGSNLTKSELHEAQFKVSTTFLIYQAYGRMPPTQGPGVHISRRTPKFNFKGDREPELLYGTRRKRCTTQFRHDESGRKSASAHAFCSACLYLYPTVVQNKASTIPLVNRGGYRYMRWSF